MKVGLLKRKSNYHFFNLRELVHHFILHNYTDKCVLILFNCQQAFEYIPKLNILKRDNFDVYQLGLNNEMVIIQFNSTTLAEDFVFGFPEDLITKIPYQIYNNGILIRTEKGKVNYRWDQKENLSKEKLAKN